MFLRCLSGNNPKQWTNWLTWIEYVYNTGCQSSIKCTPFNVIYGKPPPSLLNYIRGTTINLDMDIQLRTRDELLQEVKFHLANAQERMKQNYDRKRRELELKEG